MQVSQKYSPSDVSLHSSKKDCWLVIHGKVYDVTTFLEDHPGGDEVLLHASATGDATQSFEEVGHSSTATSMMEGYLIGVVEGHEVAGASPKAKGRSNPLLQEVEKPPRYQSSFTELIKPVLVVVLAVVAWYYITYCQPKA